MALRFRFLTGDVNPLAAVLLRDDVVLCQVRQVCPSDASESRKDEQVPRMAQSVRGQLGFQQLLELLIRQVAVVHRDFLYLVPRERVTLEDMPFQGEPRHLVQQNEIVVVRRYFQPQHRGKVEREVGHEAHGQRAQRDVLHAILVLHEIVDMFSQSQVADVSVPCPVYAHTFGIFFVVFVHQRKQGFLHLRLARHGVLDDFCRHEAVTVHVLLVGGTGFGFQRGQGVVQSDQLLFLLAVKAFLAPVNGSPARVGIPVRRLDFQPRGILADLAVKGYAPHDRAFSVFLQLLPVDVEQ